MKWLYKTMNVIKGKGDLHHGYGWLPTHLDGSLLLMASDFIIWLQMAHIAPKRVKMAQYGSIWLLMDHRGSCSQLWLPMDTDGSIWL